MKNFTIILSMLLFSAVISTKAQETVAATGGEASGGGSTVSYSVGQLFYTTQAGTNGNTVAQGVQQPYEISIVTGIPEAEGINIDISAYPNPTTNFLTVKAKDYKTDHLQYMLFDVNGKLLQIVKATGQETKIKTSQLVKGIYFVKVIDSQRETGQDKSYNAVTGQSHVIKIFKIIKK